jgi:hypothetical protein
MNDPGFLELVPIHKVTAKRPLIFGSVKDYSGPNAEIYFDFVTFMQKWLIFPMIIGLLTVAINIYFSFTVDNSPVDFIYAIMIMVWSIFFITKWEQRERWHKITDSGGRSDEWLEHQKIIRKKDFERRESPVRGQF